LGKQARLILQTGLLHHRSGLLEAARPSQDVPRKSELFALEATQLPLRAKFRYRRASFVKNILDENVKFFLAADLLNNRWC